ncbi:MAG: thioredoxin family protein [Terriglobia bacterium]|nr:thioredoxin family protein [Terriglobia bacterium]
MTRTASTMLALGTTAPGFSLPDVISGQRMTRDQVAGSRGLLVMFLCAHCPFVQHVNAELARLGHDYAGRGIGIVAIGSNDADAYPDDAPEGLRAQATQHGFTFPYLYDETQEIARAYQAVCTPDYFLFDAEKKLVYRGQLDSSRPGNGIAVDGRDLRAAMDSVLAGTPVAEEQQASIGCSIKWK